MNKPSRGKAAVFTLAVLVTGAIPAGAVASTTADLHLRSATIACSAPANGGFPSVSLLRASHTGCVTARSVAEGIQAGWQAHGALPASFDIYAGGPVFRCRYRVHRGTDNPYKTARCTSGRELVTMELGS